MQNVQAVLEAIDFEGLDAGRAHSAVHETAWRLALTLSYEEVDYVVARVLERLSR
jgi:hypothetical protein